MNSHHFNRHSVGKSAPVLRQWWALPAAFLSTLLALPVHAAVVIPDAPLTAGGRVAPNVLFILDDSGSMSWRNINNQKISKISGSGSFSSSPDADGVFNGTGVGSESTGDSVMYMQNYVTNTLYYNPNTNYLPWMGPNGTRLSGGTDYTSAYSSSNYASNDGNGSNGGSKDLSSSTQTIYVPKDMASTDTAYLSDVGNYYRYQIPAGGTSIARSVWGQVTDTGWIWTGVNPNSNPNTVTGSQVNVHTISGVPAGALLYLQIESKNSRHAHYELEDSTGAVVCTLQFGDSDTKNCQVQPTISGNYTLRVTDAFPDNNLSKYVLAAWYRQSNRCGSGSGSYDWIDCEYGVTPTGRTLDAEKINFATWYSFHRTRIKAAKAGAADAFRPLDKKVRVGYRSIWGRNSFDIPVTEGDGRFYNDSTVNPAISNRSTWYQHLFAAAASNGTPLQSALNNAGKYFMRDDNGGPYGPESGTDQLSCRQNFSILTTDGYWNSSIVNSGNQDGTDGSTIEGAKDASYKYVASAPYKDGISNTLADVAMKYWKTDLRTEDHMGNTGNPDHNNVPISGADPAFWQHMVTFSIAIGLQTTTGWKSVSQATTAVNGGAGWPDPDTSAADNDNQKRLDDLLHAAVNGHGAFVSASSPDEFTDGLTNALAAITQRTGSGSAVAANTVSLDAGAKAFNASYVSGLWSGRLGAKVINEDGTLASSYDWDTADSSTAAFASRTIYTRSGSSLVAFPTSGQTTALERLVDASNNPLGPSEYPVSGADNAAYIKGNQSKEGSDGGKLRVRSGVMGDIIHSSPAYVADTNTIYVGANDGMLHAFNAANGKEVFAYVPTIIDFSQLRDLSRGDYSHHWFVDGPIVVDEKTLITGANTLVGTLGRGGKGLYSLDVTNASAPVFNWEMQDTAGNNMGMVLGRPVLAKVNTGDAAVVFGNGLNSTSGKAVLEVLNLDTGAVIAEIDTSNFGGPTTNNGLSGVAGLLGPDGVSLKYVYAGDLQGNVWKFDLSDANKASWTATKLFTAATGQSITSGVTVAIDPKTNKRWVLFGTGKYLEDTDIKNTTTQSMYGIIDSGTGLTRNDLTARGFSVSKTTEDGYPVRAFDEKTALPAGSNGWYVDLPAGERIVQDAQMSSTYLITSSMSPSGDACGADGSGYINAIDAFTGTSGGHSYFNLPGDDAVKDGSGNDVPVGSVDMGSGSPTLATILRGLLLVGGSSSGEGGSLNTQPPQWDRMSWREVRND